MLNKKRNITEKPGTNGCIQTKKTGEYIYRYGLKSSGVKYLLDFPPLFRFLFVYDLCAVWKHTSLILKSGWDHSSTTEKKLKETHAYTSLKCPLRMAAWGRIPENTRNRLVYPDPFRVRTFN